MTSAIRLSLLVTALAGICVTAAERSSLPKTDVRADTIRGLNTPRTFPDFGSKPFWNYRDNLIGHQAIISCGLWPKPTRHPLNPQFVSRVERGDYSVENVYIETHPGFFLAGNLYRPLNQGKGPFPGILSPHGHWSNGRLVDQKDGSVAARCINFARQGIVAFAYDMVGYNDTTQADHNFANSPEMQLRGINLMGLQTWNSIRALDFLESLEEVDPKRLGCTGASGGGTQTFILGAVDHRLAAVAPMVMVSHSMQGGCLCENAPGLRVEFSNMEYAAAAAPTPQLLVAATGDWTKTTMDVEGPAIQSVYKVLGAEDRFRYVLHDFPHNYNQTTREEAYQWFGRWLTKHPDPQSLKEKPYQKEPDEALLVWKDKKRPEHAITDQQLIDYLIQENQRKITELTPNNKGTLKRYFSIIRPAWRHVMQINKPDRGLLVEPGENENGKTFRTRKLSVGRADKGDRIPVTMISPLRDRLRSIVILAHREGQSAYLDGNGEPTGLARLILDSGHTVVLFDAFLTGRQANPERTKARDHFKNRYFTTYNKTDLQQRVQDLVTVAAFARTHGKGRKLVLCGAGQGGLWCLLGAEAGDAIVADAGSFDINKPDQLLSQDFFTPGLLRYNGLDTASSLIAPRPMLMHQAGDNFPVELTRIVYGISGVPKRFRHTPDTLPDETLVSWINSLPKNY